MKPRRLISFSFGLLTAVAVLLRAAAPDSFDEDNTGQAPPGSTDVGLGSAANAVVASPGPPNSDVSTSSNEQSLPVGSDPTGSSPGEPDKSSASKWAWPTDSHWNTLPPLPDVRYAVVPLAALGIPEYTGDGWAEALDDKGGLLYTFTRMLPPEEYGYNYYDEPYLVRMRAYWRPGASDVAEYYGYYLNDDNPIYGGITPYGWASSDYQVGWDWSALAQIPYPKGVLRQLSSNGLYASAWRDYGLLANYPNVWATVGVRLTPGPLPFLSNWTSLLAQPNTFGWVPAGFSLQGYPPVGEAVGVNRFGHLIVRQSFYLTTNHWPSPEPDSYGHSYAGLFYDSSGNARPLLGTDTLFRGSANFAASSSGLMFDPWFINDRDQVAGFRVSSVPEDPYGLVSEPGIAEAGQFRPLKLPPGAAISFTGLTSGWPLPQGNGPAEDSPLVPPLAYGWSEREVTEVVNGQPETRTILEFWRARREPGASAGWKTSLFTVFDPAANLATDTPLPPAPINTGWLLMNDRLEAIFGNHRIVRNQRVYDLNNLAGGLGLWDIWATDDLNNSGVILARAAATSNYWGEAIAPEDRITEQVLLVPVTMEWRQAPGGGEVSDNKTPTKSRFLFGKNTNEQGVVVENIPEGTWMPGHGQRIFPDKLSPNDAIERNTVKLRVTVGPALAGQTVYVRAFDVDDPVDRNFDKKGQLDENDWKWNGPVERVYDARSEIPGWVDNATAGDYRGAVGNDNRDDTLDTPKAGRFLAGSNITLSEAGDIASGIVGAQGYVDFIFQVGMQPGNNYRVAMTLDPNEAGFDTLQVDGSQVDGSTGYYGYVTWVSDQRTIAGFGGVLSPMLTVWRKLYLEFDSMEAGPPTTGPQGNVVTGTVGNAHTESNGETTLTLHVNGSNNYLQDENRFENGKIAIADAGEFSVKRNWSVFNDMNGKVMVTGFSGASVSGKYFSLIDDDDFYLTNAGISPLLPYDQHSDEITKAIQSVYTDSYILLVDANTAGLNPSPSRQIPFLLNQSVGGLGDPLAENMVANDSPGFWFHRIVFGYQSSRALDSDPNDGPVPNLGETPKNWILLMRSRGYSAIFLETIRDVVMPLLSSSELSTPYIMQNRNKLFYNKLYAAIAHEIGHSPNRQTDATDHAEGSLMAGEVGSLATDYFSAATVRRFRSSNSWR